MEQPGPSPVFGVSRCHVLAGIVTNRRAPARRSLSRVLSRPAPKRATGMAIHLGPPVTRRLMRPTRGLGSAPLPRSGHPVRVAPSYLALLRVEFAAFHSAIRPESRAAASSLWHWSSSRDGRALPATLRWGARTFLTGRTGSLRRFRATIRPPRWRPESTPAGVPPTPVLRHGPDRWPRWPGHQRRCSGPAAHARPSSARTRQGPPAKPPTAG